VARSLWKRSIIYFLAGIGMTALLYGAWVLYEQHAANEEARHYLTAPVPSGLPNPLFGTPVPPPPQP